MRLRALFQDLEGRLHPVGQFARPLRQVGGLVLIRWQDKTRALVPHRALEIAT